jgi:hypothetical protein
LEQALLQSLKNQEASALLRAQSRNPNTSVKNVHTIMPTTKRSINCPIVDRDRLDIAILAWQCDR